MLASATMLQHLLQTNAGRVGRFKGGDLMARQIQDMATVKAEKAEKAFCGVSKS
jgi:hypothetical protein